MKNLGSLPLQQQFNQLMQDVKKLKKETISLPETRSKLQSTNKVNNISNEKEIKQILFKSESQTTLRKTPHNTSYDFGRVAAVAHKKRVMQEISNIKRIKEPITNYQEFLRDAHILSQIEDCMSNKTSIQQAAAEAYDFEYNTTGDRYLEKMGMTRERSSLSTVFMENVKTIPKIPVGTLDRTLLTSASTRNLRTTARDKENRYTVELRKLVLERKSLRSVQRL